MPKKKTIPVLLAIYGLPECNWSIVAEWSCSQTRAYSLKMKHIKTFSTCCGIILHNNLKVGFNKYDNQELIIELVPSPLDMECYNSYANSIYYENPPDMAPCLDKIKSGKCRDPFVIEHIGKVFFADKYTTKTK